MLFGRHINKYYLKYLVLYIIGIASLIVVDYFQVRIPEYLGDLVSVMTAKQNVVFDDISNIIFGLIQIAIIMFIGRILWRLALFGASSSTQADIRGVMFAKCERLSERYYHENKVGNIMSLYTSDMETLEEFIGFGTLMIVDASFLSILVIVRMLILDWFLSVIVFVPLILIIIWGLLVEKFQAEKWNERQKSYDKLYDFSQETFSGIRVIKAFVKENKELHYFAKMARVNKDKNVSYAKMTVIFDVLIEIIIALILAIILGVGGYLVYLTATSGSLRIFNYVVDLTPGKLITFVGYFDFIIWPMIALGQIISMRARAKASLRRITKFLDEKEEIKDKENAVELDDVKGKITFNNFSFAYPSSEANVLKNITFEIKSGEIIGVVGKVGAGKSTLVNSLLRFYNVEEKQILIDDIDIMDMKLASLRELIAYVPQNNFLFSDNIANNISFYTEETDLEKVKDAARFANVDTNIEEFKNQYATVCGERGVTLSGGQKQRISIARAYIKNAPIMILDDSVSAVDVKTEEAILNNIRNDRKGKTTIVIASRVSTVEKLDRILVLNDNTVEAFDTHDNLLLSSPTYKKMVYLQRLEKEVE